MSFEPLLLAPEEERAEQYPYRRVWRTSAFEIGTVLMTVVVVVLATNLLGVLPTELRDPLPKIGLAVLPLAAWFVFSYRGERRAIEPRPKLIGMLILGALMANGLLIPLEERLFTPNSWLPDASFFGRVLGFTLTIGIVSEFMRYAVLRYTIWPQCFRQRLDGIAYALAVSMGFATMYNLRIATDPDITLVATALRVASITFSQLSLGLFAGFFLAELKIVRPPIFWMPSGVFGAALLSGFYFAFRNIAIIGGIKLGSTASSPIRGLLLAAGVVIVMFVVFAFIIDNADARMEAQTGRRQTL